VPSSRAQRERRCFTFLGDSAKVRAVNRSTRKSTGKKGRQGKALPVHAR
jgi:hypothetical protein